MATYASRISESAWPARMRFTMSVRIARDSGALLSETDSPTHTGHASSLSSRSARAAGELLGPDRAASTTPAITTTAASASHGTHPHLEVRRLKRKFPQLAPRAATLRARPP